LYILFIISLIFSSSSKPRYTPHILGRRFALKATSYKYLDIGINVEPMSSVEIVIGDNRGNQIILPHTTWKIFIERRANIEQLVQSPTPSSLAIQDLIVEIVKLHGVNMLKLKSRNICLYMKSSTVLFIFDLEHCINHTYFELYKNTYVVNEKFKQFITYLSQNCIVNRIDVYYCLNQCAANSLRKIYDKNSNVEMRINSLCLK